MKKLGARVRRVGSPGTVLGVVALCVALGGTAIAANTINSADVINNSLKGIDVKNKSLTKKDFRGSVRGPRGPQGARGATGATGPAGPTASGFGTANPEPDTADIGTTPTDLASTTVTTTAASSRIVANASMTFGGTPREDVECVIRVNGADAGLTAKERISDAFDVFAITGAATVSAGTHTVAVRCARTTGGGVIAFTQGQISAVAAGL